jgi:ABC-type Mn2+/Zn2+ transport system permease subunit
MGVFIISLNLIPLRFAMMHVALLGGAIGLFLKLDPMILGLTFCAIASMALGPISERMKLGVGTVSGYFMALTLAIAFVLFSKGNIHVIEAFSILWGNILSLSKTDLIIIGVLSLSILGIVLLFFKEIQTMLYDREIAINIGLPEKFLYYLIVFVLGLTIAVSMRVIGALLVDAFVLLPALGASIISKSLRQLFFFSSIFGLVSGLSGLYISFIIDIPTSSAIIIITSLIIGSCTILRRRFI